VGLETFPLRGASRDDLGPGVRLLGFERRVAIAYAVEDDEVVILGVFYGGRDFEAILRGGS
jgi:plasmid stabilization system protein ParE